MATYYFNAAAGSTGTGTSGSPWNATQIATMQSTVASGDTVNFAGLLENMSPTFSNTISFSASNLTLQQWAGQNRFFMLGAKAAGSGWTNSATDTHNCTISTLFSESAGSVAPGCVVWRYFDPANQTPEGARKCFLQRVVDAATVASTSNSWFYNSSTGVLTVNIAGSGTTVPTTYTGKIDAVQDTTSVTLSEIYVGRSTGVPILFTASGTNNVIDGLYCGISAPISNTASYGFFFGSNANSVIKNCKAWNCGYHHFGSYGNNNTNNKFINCAGYNIGCSGGSGGTIFVSYADSTVNLTNSYSNCVAYTSWHLGRNGYEVPTGTGETKAGGSFGYYSHTAGTSKVIDLQYNNCICYSGTANNIICPGWGVANASMTQKASKLDPSSYGTRVIDSQQILVQTTSSSGISPPYYDFGAPMAFQRCKLDLGWTFTTTLGQNIDGGAQGRFRTYPAYSIDILFESCDIELSHGDNSTNNLGFFCTDSNGAARNCSFIFNGCTIRDLSSLSTSTGYLFITLADSLYVCYNCIFVNPTGGNRNRIANTGWSGGSAIIDIQKFFDFRGNIYVGYDSTAGYGSAAFANSFAEWSASPADNAAPTSDASVGIDPRSIAISYNASDWVNINTSGALTSNSSLLAYTRGTGISVINKSVDGRYHTGYGAYAYGATPKVFGSTRDSVIPLSYPV